MSTIPDPRSRRVSATADDASDSHSPTQHPDLNDEVATLSTKLINAINHQTVLDDRLSETRQELDTANNRIREIETENTTQRQTLQTKLDSETTARTEVEQEKKKIEQELENLTTALFEEANRMVITAKEEAQQQQEVVQKKNDQLKAQLQDSEALLQSQQDQLTELKRVLESMSLERDDQTNITTPSSPGITKFESNVERLAFQDSTVSSPVFESVAPAPPTSLQHLIQPVLRYDLGAYEDFIGLARHSKSTGNRASSSSMGGFAAALSLGLGGSTSSNHNASTTSLGAALQPNSTPQSPNGTTTPGQAPLPSLKETKFYKRALVEDIEPTLRLDSAPGLSWLARRSVLTAVTEGTLVVEPAVSSGTARPQYFPCSLCGESRKDASFLRNHRFRTTEAGSAQSYPLCGYCLNRVRSTCGFLGFMRMVKDGHWRADDEDHEKAAWEESVRLREHMFWARIGGGVVPASQVDGSASDAFRSPRVSQERTLSEGQSSDKAPTITRLKAEDTVVPTVEAPKTPPEQTAAPTFPVAAES